MGEQENLFQKKPERDSESASAKWLKGPLPDRVRPRRLEQYVGHEALIGPGAPLRKAIEEDRVHSFLLWGPPGSGKTTLARIVAEHTESEFVAMSAVMAGVKDIKEVVEQARRASQLHGRKTILFVDEIHRFNKSQQDALLPYVEDGTLTLIGATTENPSFEVNSALLSRVVVYVLKPLSKEQLVDIMQRALADATFGLAAKVKNFPPDWVERIAEEANGDARRGLGLLERVADHLGANPSGPFTEERLKQAIGQKSMRYDANGDEHYNTISAFIKSLRDSDPDAGLYYLARMLEAGEDPLFIARRMVIFASEDVGNADPRALTLAVAVRDAVDFIGMPEARICLAQGVTFLASAAKSNASYMGIEAALSDVREHGNLEIPLHVRNAPSKLMKNLGYGKGYKYAHNFEDQVTGMINLPDALRDRKYYEPKDVGLEKQIREKTDFIRARRKPS